MGLGKLRKLVFGKHTSLENGLHSVFIGVFHSILTFLESALYKNVLFSAHDSEQQRSRCEEQSLTYRAERIGRGGRWGRVFVGIVLEFGARQQLTPAVGSLG